MMSDVFIVESLLREKIIVLREQDNPMKEWLADELEHVADELSLISRNKPTKSRKEVCKRMAQDPDSVFVHVADEPLSEM